MRTIIKLDNLFSFSSDPFAGVGTVTNRVLTKKKIPIVYHIYLTAGDYCPLSSPMLHPPLLYRRLIIIPFVSSVIFRNICLARTTLSAGGARP